jgi:hypothetical protein
LAGFFIIDTFSFQWAYANNHHWPLFFFFFFFFIF